MLCREALRLCSDFHPLSATICHTLGWIDLFQFRRSGGEQVIDEAVYMQRVGLERLLDTESHSRHRHLRDLGQALAAKHGNGRHQGTDEILSVMSEAFQVCPPTHIDRWEMHSQMMQQMLNEHYRSGDFDFLDRGLKLGRQALSMGYLPNNSRRAIFLTRMADILRVRHEVARTNDTDLAESVELCQEAVRISSPEDINYWIRIYCLARVLVLQFRADGDVNHLEEASQLYHYASNIISEANQQRPYIISSFANSLGLRFRETGDISELNRAISLDEEAVAAWRPSTVDYTDAALQMVTHLCLRFEMIHEDDDLKKAISVAEELLESISEDNVNHHEAIHILAKARLLHALDKDQLGYIDLAIEQLLSIKDELLQSSSGPDSLRTLAACHLVKFRHSSSAHYALQAREIINEVLGSVDPDHYERFQCLIDAAKLYMEHGTPYYNIDIALKHLSNALINSHRDIRSKIRGTKNVLLKLEMEHYNLFTSTSSTSLKLLDVIESAVSLLPGIAFFGINPQSRLQSLKEGQSIAMTGASHALNLSLPEKALEIMEQGRAVFWSHTLLLRSPFDHVPKDLRDRLLSLARRLEKASTISERSTDHRLLDIEISQRRKDSNEFNSLVEQVRCLPELEHFMLPDKFSHLKEVAQKGPVVILVSSTLACHAIVLISSGVAASIPLKEITDRWLVESASMWRSTAIDARLAMRDERKLVKSKKTPDSSYTQAKQILRLLWINVVFPVIQALQIEVNLGIICLEY
jgi:tetratricopeptide (TPR) repeat protein